MKKNPDLLKERVQENLSENLSKIYLIIKNKRAVDSLAGTKKVNSVLQEIHRSCVNDNEYTWNFVVCLCGFLPKKNWK